MKTLHYVNILVLATAVLALSACGGGGSSTPATTPPGGTVPTPPPGATPTPPIVTPPVCEYKIIKSLIDTDADGTVNDKYTYAYDDKLNEIKFEVDKNMDDVIDRNITHNYVYYDNGNIKVRTRLEESSGLISKTIIYFDINGVSEKASMDTDRDGIIDLDFLSLEVDSHGNTTKFGYDTNLDGIADFIIETTYVYDVNGNILEELTDVDEDGDQDDRYIYTYNSEGQEVTKSYNKNDDAIVEYRRRYTYDSHGNRTLIESDLDDDNIYEEKVIREYFYDSNGNVGTVHIDYDGDMIIDKIITNTFKQFCR